MTVQTGQQAKILRRIKKLAASVVDLAERNKRNPEEVAEVLQEIIDDPSRNPVPGPLSRKDFKRQVRTWEVHFADLGPRIVELLSPLYSPELSFQLRPASAGLEERVRKAIFWQDVPRIRVVHDEDADNLSGDGGLDASLRAYFMKVGNPLDEALSDVLYNTLWYRIARRTRATYREQDDVLQGNVFTVAEYAASCLIAGDTAKDFRPVIELFTTGNLPYWFDNDGTIMVLCAKVE